MSPEVIIIIIFSLLGIVSLIEIINKKGKRSLVEYTTLVGSAILIIASIAIQLGYI